jgi:ATP-dependent exoDNAse (exonuclease V) alpha subunit
MARFDNDINALHKKTKISKSTLEKIKSFYMRRRDWIELFYSNPYEVSKLNGIGFKSCDEYAKKIGYDMTSDNRVVACTKFIVEESALGHTIVEFDKVIADMMKLLARNDKSNIERIVKGNVQREGYLLYDAQLKRSSIEAKYITLELWRNTEQSIFKMCKDANLFENKSKAEIDKAIKKVESKLEFKLNEGQSEAFRSIPHHSVNILTGLGGCTTANAEVLTRDGWIKISDWSGQDIMESGVRENEVVHRLGFKKPERYHRYKRSIFYDFVFDDGFVATFSIEHRNIFYINKELNVLKTIDFFDKEIDLVKNVIELEVSSEKGVSRKRVVNIVFSEKNDTEEKMYCFTTSTSYFLVRENGVEFATGNSGKSYTTRAVLDVLDKLGESYTLLAPTGCAVKVLSNSTGRNSMTIHRKYYADYILREELIETDWIIVDEVSMCSLEHFKMIVDMMSRNHKLLFIGDISQLVPISEGCAFRDLILLIESKMIEGNVVHLTEIMRSKSDSAIAHICKMFTRHGEYQKEETKKKHSGVEFIDIDRSNFLGQIESVIKGRKFDLKETFVLSAFNVREFGTEVINNHIQKVFSKGRVVYKDKFKQYKVGDFLMHTKNNTALKIFNGERVVLTADTKAEYYDGEEVIYHKCLKVDDGDVVWYTREKLMYETRLSYAISIHKSQGSSLKNTILVIDSSHQFSLSRNAIYTAMSRASENLVVIFDDSALLSASRKNDVEKRNTFLRALWGLNMKKRLKENAI